MKSFQFPLEKALELRRVQLELEEAKHKRQVAAVAAIDGRRAEIEASGIRAEIEVRQWSPIGSGDLAALGNYRLKVKSEESALALLRDELRVDVDGLYPTMTVSGAMIRLFGGGLTWIARVAWDAARTCFNVSVPKRTPLATSSFVSPRRMPSRYPWAPGLRSRLRHHMRRSRRFRTARPQRGGPAWVSSLDGSSKSRYRRLFGRRWHMSANADVPRVERRGQPGVDTVLTADESSTSEIAGQRAAVRRGVVRDGPRLRPVRPPSSRARASSSAQGRGRRGGGARARARRGRPRCPSGAPPRGRSRLRGGHRAP